MKYQILQGDNRDTLKTLADNSIDAIVTDPPYGIDFLGKSWDANTGALETYQECLRVLKPGGHILAFSAARTYHHLAVTLEQAGFEIRDQIMWIYSSGFPKSQDIGRSIQRSLGVKKTRKVKDDGSKAKHYDYGMKASNENDQVIATDPEAVKWSGWGTALKPAHEPIALARKPMRGSIKDNCVKWGVGAINIDATRIPYENQKDIDTYLNNKRGPMERGNDEDGKNIRMFNGETGFKAVKREVTVEQDLPELGRFPSNVIGEILQEDYQKYFYCPKVSRKERHIGFEDPGPMFQGDRFDVYMPTAGKTDPDKQISAVEKKVEGKGNNHPTVKPIELMKYLIKLITPPGGTVLDPFNGSGSTGCAAVELGHEYIGCELDPVYVEISLKRIAAWNKQDNNFEALFSAA